MSKDERKNGIFTLKDILPPSEEIRDLFLDENIDPFSQWEKLQKILGLIWDINFLLYPQGKKGEMTLTVPSRFLVEVGLVSGKTQKEIEEREERENAVNNKLRITKTSDDTFEIRETYVTRREDFDLGSLDSVAEEITTLKRNPDGSFEITIKGRDLNPRLYAFSKVWVPQIEKEEEFRELEITSRRLNTTLALLIEGLQPGHLASQASQGVPLRG